MTKILKIEDEKGETIKPIPTIDNKLELLKHISEVQSRIKEHITTDFTYAKLDEQNKKAIIEMTTNAYYGITLIKEIENKATIWKWNNEKKQWEQRKLNKKEKEIMNERQKRIFDAFMTKVFMTTILNRNTKDNYLIRIMAGLGEEEVEKEKEEENEKTIIEKLTNKLKKEEKN